MPLAQACLASDNPYQRKGGLMCLAVLAEGCGDHIRTKYGSLTRVRHLLGKFGRNLSTVVSPLSLPQDAVDDAADGVPESLRQQPGGAQRRPLRPRPVL